GQAYALQLHDAVAHAQDEAADPGGSLTAPMPGKIISVAVQPGDRVKAGDTLLVMEAMKMEHTIHAPREGVVQEIYFQPGEQVSDGEQLIALSDAWSNFRRAPDLPGSWKQRKVGILDL